MADFFAPFDPPLPQPVTASVPAVTETTVYGLAALQSECERVAAAPEGCRNDTLNKAAFALGRLVAAGALEEAAARAALASAAQEAGLPPGEAGRTIGSGLAA